MATLIEMSGMHEDYADVVKSVLRHGCATKPRGLETRELTDVTLTLEDPYDALPVGTNRGLNLAIGAAEAVQLIGAISDPGLMVHVAANFGRFLEPSTGRFWGAYGDRVGSQVHHVIRKLREDRDTRQAVITLWNPALDNVEGRLDYPCTVSLVLRIRRDALELTTFMRSNDVMLGLPYDVFQFTQLQITVARCIGVDVGAYTHVAASLHLYETDYERAEGLHAGTKGPLIIEGLGERNGADFHAVQMRAQLIIEAAHVGGLVPHEFAPSEVWYVKQLSDALWQAHP